MNRSNAQMGFIGVYLILKGWHLRINKRRLGGCDQHMYSKVHQLSSSTNLSLHEHEYGSSASCFNLCTKISDLSTLFKPLRSKILQLLLERGIVLQNYPIFGQTDFCHHQPPLRAPLAQRWEIVAISVGTGNSVGEDLTAGGSSKGRAQWFPNLYHLNEKYRKPPYFTVKICKIKMVFSRIPLHLRIKSSKWIDWRENLTSKFMEKWIRISLQYFFPPNWGVNEHPIIVGIRDTNSEDTKRSRESWCQQWKDMEIVIKVWRHKTAPPKNQ